MPTPRQALKRGMEALGLQGWAIQVETGPTRPDWVASKVPYGAGKWNIHHRTGLIWVDPAVAAANYDTVEATIYHECAHMALHEAGLKAKKQTVHAERLCNYIAEIMLAQKRRIRKRG